MKLQPTFLGTVDQFERGMVSGWALDRRRPLESIEVDLYVDSEKVTSFLADRERPDLRKVSPGSHKKGFYFDLRQHITNRLFPRIELFFPGSCERIPASVVASRFVNRPVIDLGQLQHVGYSPWTPSPPGEIVRYITGIKATEAEQRHNYLYSGMVNSTDLYNIFLDAGLDVNKPDFSILDIGCGSGRYASYLKQYIRTCKYLGVDIWPDAIHWAQKAISPLESDLKFILLDERAGYAGSKAYKLPTDNGVIDVIIAMSLFTHLDFEASLGYFVEIRRVLTDDGIAALTFNLLDDEESRERAIASAAQANLPLTKTSRTWSYGREGYLDIFYHPEAVRQIAEQSGLNILAIRKNHWSHALPNQEMVLLRRAGRLHSFRAPKDVSLWGWLCFSCWTTALNQREISDVWGGFCRRRSVARSCGEGSALLGQEETL